MANFMYDPKSTYGYQAAPGPWGQAKSYMDTYLGSLDIELQPQSYFTHKLASQGYGGIDGNSMLARNMYGKVQDDYGAARLKNNQLTWKSFLDNMDIGNTIGNLLPEQKGMNTSNVVPHNVRWLPR